jgi:hypothetical protein
MKFSKLRGLHKHTAGQTIVEVLVAIGIAGILLPALATAVAASRAGRAQEEERVQAAALLREADEAVRSVREKGWATFAVNGTYKPAISGSAWTLSSGAETLGNFTRQVVISDAQRNASGALVNSGGTVDPSTKKVVSTVSWSLPLPSSVTSENYFQRYAGNTAWTQTTQAELNAGTKTNTTVTATDGGQVELTNTPGSTDWTAPSIIGSYNAAGTQDALDIFTVGNYAYLCDGTVLTILNISNPASPTLVGTYTASATVRHVYVDGNYAYLSTASDTAELIILNISNPASPTVAASVNLADTNDALTAFVTGGYAYVGRAVDTTTGTNEFYIVNVTTPTSPVVQGGINLTGAVNNIKVSGSFAFLATAVDTTEVVVANVTNKASPSVSGNYNAVGTADGNDLGIAGTTLYLATLSNASGAEVFSLNIATPSTPTLLDTYEVANTVTGVSPISGYLFLSTAILNQQLIVLDSASPNNLLLKSNFNLGSTANDVKGSGNYAYIASPSNTQELMVVGPTITAGGYQTSGAFESSTLDAGATVGFNYLNFTLTEPASTNVQFQIATNTDNATWNYVGPDGTASTFYTVAGAVPLAKVSGRYLRYKATLTGPGTSTPVVSDVSVNYAP